MQGHNQVQFVISKLRMAIALLHLQLQLSKYQSQLRVIAIKKDNFSYLDEVIKYNWITVVVVFDPYVNHVLAVLQ